MTARWVEAAFGFVVPTAAVLWGVWLLWHWFRPPAVKRPPSFVTAVVGFLLVCVLVILIVVAWEMFQTWR